MTVLEPRRRSSEQHCGCVLVTLDGVRYFSIWPAGGAAAEIVALPGCRILADGETFTASGALAPTAPLVPDGNGYWARFIGFCVGNPESVAVIDAVE